ncbi:hypothetical protein HBI64_000830 [Parastagonospora nodorum]|nr:hypothetical protein HBI64_000830 [Parastagonospora nodorum]
MGHIRRNGRISKSDKRRKRIFGQFEVMSTQTVSLPQSQTQLLLYQARQPYELAQSRNLPSISSGELLVQVLAVGLNPIDWKSAAYGFALPAFPCVNGRELVGKIVRQHSSQPSDFEVGDVVLSIATDYRDFRKSGFQEYAVVDEFNAVRLPKNIYAPQAASVGVAFVAATISLGVCLGMTMSHKKGLQMDLLNLARAQGRDDTPEDIVKEVFDGIEPQDRPVAGDWILIYGASTITGQIAIQLAKWSGMRTVVIANKAKHGELLERLGSDLIIDRSDLDQAAIDIHAAIPAPIRFAFDTVGVETATWCQGLLADGHDHDATAKSGEDIDSRWSGTSPAHLVCLVGSPKERLPGVRTHQVPIKLFHANRDIGHVLSNWLSILLGNGRLTLPETVYEDGGLAAIGPSLDRIRSGELSGRRLVVRLGIN